MKDWNFDFYCCFEDECICFVCDLLVWVLFELLCWVVDFGCGFGNLIELLVECFFVVEVVGIDNFVVMLDSVCECLFGCWFELVDIVGWMFDEVLDLIYVNVVL